MSGGDVALAVAAGAALLIVVAASGGASGVRIERGIAGRLIALAGAVVAGIAVYHVVSKPGAGAGSFSSIVQVKYGIAVAASGGLLMIVGGLLTARAPQVAAFEPESSPATPTFEPPQAAVVPDPFAAPAPEPEEHPVSDPFAAPDSEPRAALDPFADPEPQPQAASDPFADPPAPEPSGRGRLDSEPQVVRDPIRSRTLTPSRGSCIDLRAQPYVATRSVRRSRARAARTVASTIRAAVRAVRPIRSRIPTPSRARSDAVLGARARAEAAPPEPTPAFASAEPHVEAAQPEVAAAGRRVGGPRLVGLHDSRAGGRVPVGARRRRRQGPRSRRLRAPPACRSRRRAGPPRPDRAPAPGGQSRPERGSVTNTDPRCHQGCVVMSCCDFPRRAGKPPGRTGVAALQCMWTESGIDRSSRSSDRSDQEPGRSSRTW